MSDFALEKYRGSKTRHTCPNCGNPHEFARYMNIETSDYLAPDVGRCNRQGKCGYHFTPKEYFRLNPDIEDAYQSSKSRKIAKKKAESVNCPPVRIPEPEFINPQIFTKTLANYENNAFVEFLFDLFPEDVAEVEKAVKDYLLGTTRDGSTIFWQIDRNRNIRTGKIITYDRHSGKRQKNLNWVHSLMVKTGKYPEGMQPEKCLFGEHLLDEDFRSVAIVEAEKTAVIASICFPQILWLASGGLDQLSLIKMQPLAGREIILYPDANGFAKWSKIAQDAAARGFAVTISSLLEKLATDEQKEKGDDIADYLIDEQRRVNRFNSFADQYNSAVDRIQADTKLLMKFNTILDCEKAELMHSNGLSETKAEAVVIHPDSLHRVVCAIVGI